MAKIVVDPVTRIEGHLRIEAVIEDGKIKDAWSSSTMWRGIENILKGRDPREAWYWTQRFCGVCTTVHSMASIRAVEDALSDFPRNLQQDGLAWPFAQPPGTSHSWPDAVAESRAPYLTSASGLRVLAQLHYPYILAQTADGLAIADQHAAHEQVLFEQLSCGSTPIPLSPPSRLDLPPQEIATLERIASTLSGLGLEIEPFGGRSFVVRTLPQPIQRQDPREIVTTLLQEAARMRGSEQELRDLLARPTDTIGREMNHVWIAVKDQPRVLVRSDQADRATSRAVDATSRGKHLRRRKR